MKNETEDEIIGHVLDLIRSGDLDNDLDLIKNAVTNRIIHHYQKNQNDEFDAADLVGAEFTHKHTFKKYSISDIDYKESRITLSHETQSGNTEYFVNVYSIEDANKFLKQGIWRLT